MVRALRFRSAARDSTRSVRPGSQTSRFRLHSDRHSRCASAAGLLLVLSALLGLGLGLPGCDSGGERPPLDEDGGSGGAGGAAGASSEETIRLPFAVDDHFFNTGHMGAEDVPSVVPQPNDCAAREDGAQGRCHCYEYAGGPSETSWAGLYWLAGPENWGSDPGFTVEEGAVRLSFKASSNPPGLPVAVLVGGVEESALSHQDGFRTEANPELSSQMRRFEVDLSDLDYSGGVIGAFGFIAFGETPGTLCFDDIRWE